MRAHEFVNEVFNIGSPPDTEWRTLGAEHTTTPYASWKDPTGKQVNTYFMPHPEDPYKTIVGFSRDGETKRTGTAGRQSPQVFGGVMHNIKDYLEKNPHVQSIQFDSVSDPKRSKLYTRMINKMAPQAGLELADIQKMTNAYQQAAARSSTPTIAKSPTTGRPTIQKGPAPATATDRFTLKRSSISQTPSQGKTVGGPIGSAGPVSTGASDLLHQMNPQRLY